MEVYVDLPLDAHMRIFPSALTKAYEENPVDPWALWHVIEAQENACRGLMLHLLITPPTLYSATMQRFTMSSQMPSAFSSSKPPPQRNPIAFRQLPCLSRTGPFLPEKI